MPTAGALLTVPPVNLFWISKILSMLKSDWANAASAWRGEMARSSSGERGSDRTARESTATTAAYLCHVDVGRIRLPAFLPEETGHLPVSALPRSVGWGVWRKVKPRLPMQNILPTQVMRVCVHGIAVRSVRPLLVKYGSYL